MSYAVPLLSLHLPDDAESRFAWPLVGSLSLHVIVLIAFVSLRLPVSLEQPFGSYEVTLVTLPGASKPPTSSPETATTPRVAKVSPPPEAKEAPPPERVRDSLAEAPDSVVVPKPRAPVSPPKTAPAPIPPAIEPLPIPEASEPTPPPERVRDSLAEALNSVVVPKPQAPPSSPQKVVPTPAPPQSPKLALGPARDKPEPLTSPPRVELLAKKLKKVIDPLTVPKKRVPDRVPERPITADVNRKPKTIESSRSSGMTLPSKAPPLADLAPRSPEPPLQPSRESRTAESLTQALQSVRIPKNSKPVRSVSAATPLVPDVVEHSSPPTVPPPATKPDVDVLEQQIAKLVVPQPLAFEAGQENFQQTDEQALMTGDLRVSGSSPKKNPYWGRFKSRIEAVWIVHRVQFQRNRRLQVTLAFRVERNGTVKNLTVIRSSDNTYFDSTAKRAVIAASPLPAFPETMPEPFYDVRYTFKGPSDQ